MTKKGFTLIETVVYLGIACALLLCVISLWQSMVAARDKAATISGVESEGAAALQAILSAARAADYVMAPATSTTGVSLTLKMPTASTSPTSFDISGGILRITEGATAPRALIGSQLRATDFSISNLSKSGTPGSVEVRFTLSYATSTGYKADYRQEFRGAASLRRLSQ